MAQSRSPHTPKRALTEIKFDAEALLDRARGAIRKSSEIMDRTHQLILESTQVRSTEEAEFTQPSD